MTADFGKFVAKTDKKPQLKDEMKQTKHDQLKKEKRKKKETPAHADSSIVFGEAVFFWTNERRPLLWN